MTVPMRYPLLVLMAAIAVSSCGSPAASSTTSLPPPTRVVGCGDVSYIIPDSEDATITMGRIYTFLTDEKPQIEGTEFNANLLQLTRQGGYDLITIHFDNDLGTMLFVEEPVYAFHIGWEGPAESETVIRDSLAQSFPNLPADLISCQDLSYFVLGG
jgi:hypothetical protein